ncbi:hypothetical protein BDR26DRAFT_861093 [Obelidium mucronatum]|nr:hypothetical protein BDR26DRAFT_861093 [Obelidium mucronatum]
MPHSLPALPGVKLARILLDPTLALVLLHCATVRRLDLSVPLASVSTVPSRDLFREALWKWVLPILSANNSSVQTPLRGLMESLVQFLSQQPKLLRMLPKPPVMHSLHLMPLLVLESLEVLSPCFFKSGIFSFSAFILFLRYITLDRKKSRINLSPIQCKYY